MSKKTEWVLALPKPALEEHLQGKPPFVSDMKHIFGDSSWVCWLPRPYVETNENFLQVIPYAVIHSDVDVSHRILTYQRNSKQGESRLHNKYSIGFGGHIDLFEDAEQLLLENDPLSLYKQAVARELKEELGIDVRPHDCTLGRLIYNDTDEVGRVHLGISVRVFVHPSEIRSEKFEDTLSDVSWKTIDQLASMREHLEAWSQIALLDLLPLK